MSSLYIVGTPIGNLGDITIRALETLRAVDVIACEDTRHTLKLLNHFEIRKPLISCHANDEERGAANVVRALDSGKNVAYCSDAGTPGLSDPGAVLVRRAREADHVVIPVPGPSAFAALVSVAGFGGRAVLFDGFPSVKPSRRRARIAEVMDREDAVVFYESPFRIAALIRDIAAVDPDRAVCIGRELTKLHEDIHVGTASELAECFSENAEKDPSSDAIPQKGEFSVLVAGKRQIKEAR
jgi:16S rRNA (cytidine1402-2'-O)-methyltransferase